MQQLNDYELAALKRAEQAKVDLVGALWGSEIISLLGFDKEYSRKEAGAWAKIVGKLEREKGMDMMEASEIYDMISVYANVAEEKGFRIGYHVATRLFMEGMKGGASL